MSTLQQHTRWTVENTLSCVTFTVRNFGFRKVTGTVPILWAFVDVDAENRPVHVEAVLGLAGIDTGHARRDRDLRSPRLLDTERFPRMHFCAESLETADGPGSLPGTLTVRGCEQDVRLSVSGDDRHAVATAAIDRAAFGIRAPRVLIGRRIDIRIDAVLRQG